LSEPSRVGISAAISLYLYKERREGKKGEKILVPVRFHLCRPEGEAAKGGPVAPTKD